MSNLNADIFRARVELSHAEETLVVMGLGLILATLQFSGYDQVVKDEIVKRTKALLDRIQTPKVYDAYGNPY